jgi:methionine-rich copper-binding protein CopC
MRNIIAAGCALLLAAPPASAHAFLQTASPAVGSTVRQAPAEVVIDFTEGVEPDFSTVAVQSAAGADVTQGPPHRGADPQHLAVALKPLPPGEYVVTWHAVSVDTHKTDGKFRFTVDPAGR